MEPDCQSSGFVLLHVSEGPLTSFFSRRSVFEHYGVYVKTTCETALIRWTGP